MNTLDKKLKQILLGVRNGGFITPAIAEIKELIKEEIRKPVKVDFYRKGKKWTFKNYLKLQGFSVDNKCDRCGNTTNDYIVEKGKKYCPDCYGKHFADETIRKVLKDEKKEK